jgi:hypothetical protein
MDHKEVIGWVVGTVAGFLRLSQAKTLAVFVAAAQRVGRVCLPAISGAVMGGSTLLKYKIRRLWRFTDNCRVEPSDAMRGVIQKLLRKRKKRLLVAFDWTEIRNFHTLALVAVIRGRGVPLLWASYPEWELAKSQNNFEEGLLRLLRDMVPPALKVVLLADRGFGRTELGRLCQQLHFHYVIRITPDVWIKTPTYKGKLLDYPVKKGISVLLRNVEYRKNNPVVQHVIVRWKRDLPKKRDECWFLMTDLDGDPTRLSELYGRRMTIEETFRDQKSRRNGFALRNTRIQKAERFDRLLLVLALAYWLLIGLGLHARKSFHPGHWCSATKASQCSVFTIGRRMLDQLELSPAQALAEVRAALASGQEKWG